MEVFQTEFFKGILGEPGSNVPSFPIIFGYSIWAYHKLTGIPAYEIMKDGKKHAAAQLHVAKEFNLPFVVSFTDLNIVGEALGATLTYMPDVIPIHEVPAVNTAEEIESLEPADPYKSGRMPQIIETVKIYLDKFKESENIIVKGVLRWIEEEEKDFVGGIELNEILDESKWITLIHFIDNPLEERTKKMGSMSPMRQVRKSSRPSPPSKVI